MAGPLRPVAHHPAGLARLHAAGSAAVRRHVICCGRVTGQYPRLWTNVDDVESGTAEPVPFLSELSKVFTDMWLQHISFYRCGSARPKTVRRDGPGCGMQNSTNVIPEPLNCWLQGCLRNAGADSRRAVLSCSALVARLFRSGHTALRRSQFPVAPNRVPPHSNAGDGPLWERSCPRQPGTVGSEG